MPFNVAGTKNSNNLSIPRACVKIALLDDQDRPVAWRDVGDISSAQLTFDTTEAEHFTSCGEQRIRDARIAVETNVDLSMDFDHILDTDNVELFFAGDAIAAEAVSTSVAMLGALIVPNPRYTGSDPLEDPQVSGRHFKIWSNTAGEIYCGSAPPMSIDPQGTTVPVAAYVSPEWLPTHHIFGVDPADVVFTEETTAGTSNLAYSGGNDFTVAGGDFSVDADQGTIFIPVGSALAAYISVVGTANVGDKYIAVNMSYDGTTATSTSPAYIPVVQALASASRAIAVRFEQQDSNRPGFRAVTEIFKTRLIPSGDVDLVSDGTDFSTATLEGSVEQPSWMDGTEGLEGFFHKYDVAF